MAQPRHQLKSNFSPKYLNSTAITKREVPKHNNTDLSLSRGEWWIRTSAPPQPHPMMEGGMKREREEWVSGRKKGKNGKRKERRKTWILEKPIKWKNVDTHVLLNWNSSRRACLARLVKRLPLVQVMIPIKPRIGLPAPPPFATVLSGSLSPSQTNKQNLKKKEKKKVSSFEPNGNPKFTGRICVTKIAAIRGLMPVQHRGSKVT